jgi:hypothetical protein
MAKVPDKKKKTVDNPNSDRDETPLKEQIATAKAYIKDREYDKAREILKQIEHPTAQKWLNQLDKKYPMNDVDMVGEIPMMSDKQKRKVDYSRKPLPMVVVPEKVRPL